MFPVVRLKFDIRCLESLLEGNDPIRIPCRVKKTEWVDHGICDASGNGFVAVIHIGEDLQFRYG